MQLNTIISADKMRSAQILKMRPKESGRELVRSQLEDHPLSTVLDFLFIVLAYIMMIILIHEI